MSQPSLTSCTGSGDSCSGLIDAFSMNESLSSLDTYILIGAAEENSLNPLTALQ